ncbi:MAG: substrate-binding domain-containing protein [Acidobacteriaceae bacterium]|nr:substrate-binding domain-containing protein [Acidobacteriaceae bacterium]
MNTVGPTGHKLSVLLLAPLLCTVSHAQHAVKGEFQETYRAKPFAGVPAYEPVSSLSGHLRSVGADTMETLVKHWIEDFKKIYPDMSFDMEAKASGTAGPALIKGLAELGPVAREMLPNEEKEFVDKFGYKPFPVRVAGGSYRTPGKTHAIAFFVNEKNPIRELTFDQIDAMYSTTHKRGYKEVSTWGDVGVQGEYANQPIHLWGLIRPNGIAHFLQFRILDGGDYKDGITERTTVGSLAALDAIAQGVAKDPYAIGYAGFGNQTRGAKTVALARTSSGPFYKGTFDEVLNQQYPLSRVIYIYVNRRPGQPLDPKVREFLKFVLSKQGQDAVVKEGIFLPLPTALVTEELKKLD